MKSAITPLLMLLLTVPAFAQDDELPPGEPTKPRNDAGDAEPPAPEDEAARLLLSKALKGLASREEIFASATIEHGAAPAAPGGPAGVGRIVMIGGAGAQGAPVEGEVEGWRRKDGSVVIVSKEELPGFAIHVEAGRTIRRATYESQPPDLRQLEAEFVALLDVGRFARLAQRAKLVGTPDETTGSITFRGETPATLVDAMQGQNPQNPFGTKRVLRTEVEIVVTKDGGIENALVRVVHADPMQRMARGMAIQIVGGGGAPRVIPAQPGADAKDTPTGWTTYKIEFRAAPSDRAREFRRYVERTLAE